MEIRTKTFETDYNWFEVGEKVTPTSLRTGRGLEIGKTYIVTSCVAPRNAGDGSVVFVEGQPLGFDAQYFQGNALG